MADRVFKVAIALEAKNFQQTVEGLRQAWGAFTSVIEQTQGALWNATVLGFQMSIAGRQWVENLYDVATQADVIRLKMASFEMAVRTAGESMDEATAAVRRLSEEFQVMPDQVANAMGLLLRKGYDVQQATVLLERFADAAVNVGRDIADGMEAGASALLQERSILLNSVGIAENISTAFQQYADTLGKSVSSLTEAEKRQAMMNLVMQSTANRVGLASKLLQGFRGEIQRLSREWRTFIRDFGKGVGAALAPFITGMRVALQLLNAMPRSIRIVLGMFATWSSMAVLLGGVVFLAVSNILRFITTIKSTMADTLRAVSVAVETFKKARSITESLGTASLQTAKAMEALAARMAIVNAVSTNPALATLTERLRLLSGDAAKATDAVTLMARELAGLRTAKLAGAASQFAPIVKGGEEAAAALDQAVTSVRKFDVAATYAFRKLSGLSPSKALTIDPKVIQELKKAGIEVADAASLFAIAAKGIRGEVHLTDSAIEALDAALATLGAQYVNMGRTITTRGGDLFGKAAAEDMKRSLSDLERALRSLRVGLTSIQVRRVIEADSFVDTDKLLQNIKSAFHRAGLEAEIAFQAGLQSRLARGEVVKAADLLRGIESIRVWPKEFSRAEVAAQGWKNAVVISGREAQAALRQVGITAERTVASYRAAMVNMGVITRTTVEGIIALLNKLRLTAAAEAVQNFILQMSTASIGSALRGTEAAVVAQAARLGKEAGTSMAYTMTSSLAVLDALIPAKLKRFRLFRVFGTEANAFFRIFTRGANDAASAALALAEGGGLISKLVRGLNAVGSASGKLGLLARFGKLAAGILLELSNVLGFLTRAFLVLVRGVPIVGWFVLLLSLSEQFRSGTLSLGKAIVSFAVSVVQAITSVIGAFSTLVGGVLKATGVIGALSLVMKALTTLFQALATFITNAGLQIRAFALRLSRSMIGIRQTIARFVSKVPGLNLVVKFDERAARAELGKIDDQLEKIEGKIEANQRAFSQKMIDIWGPRWSKQLASEFDGAVALFSKFNADLNKVAEGQQVTSTLLKGFDDLGSKLSASLERAGVDVKRALTTLTQGGDVGALLAGYSDAEKRNIEAALRAIYTMTQLRSGIADGVRKGYLSSKELANVIDGEIAYLQDLIARMEAAGTRSQDRARLQEFIAQLKKTKEAIKENIQALDEFLGRLRDRSVKLEIQNLPEAVRRFKQMEEDFRKLREEAEKKFKGGDRAQALAALDRQYLRERLVLQEQYAKEFEKLYQDNWKRIREIVAKGVQDELEQLRIERDNAIRDTEERYKEQIARYEQGSAEAVRLEQQKEQEIAALRAYYAQRERQMLEDRQRQERQLILDHMQELLRLIGENLDERLRLIELNNNRYLAMLDEQAAAEKAAVERRRALGQIGPEEAALEQARIEQRALEQRVAALKDYAATRRSILLRENRDEERLTVERYRLEAERERARIERTVASAARRNRLLQETDSYYQKLIAQTHANFAQKREEIEQEYVNKVLDLDAQLAEARRNTEQRGLEASIAAYRKLANSIAEQMDRIAGSQDDIDALSKAISLGEDALRKFKLSGDEAAQASDALAGQVEALRQKFADLVQTVTTSAGELSTTMEDLRGSIERTANGLVDLGIPANLIVGPLEEVAQRIQALPEDLRAQAVRTLDSVTGIANRVEDALTKASSLRTQIAKALESAQLSPAQRANLEAALEGIDSLSTGLLASFTNLAKGEAEKAKAAIDDMLAKARVQQAKISSDILATKQRTAQLLRVARGETENVDVELAKIHLQQLQRERRSILENMALYKDQAAVRLALAQKDEQIAQALIQLKNRQAEAEQRAERARQEAQDKARQALRDTLARYDAESRLYAITLKRAGVESQVADAIAAGVRALRRFQAVSESSAATFEDIVAATEDVASAIDGIKRVMSGRLEDAAQGLAKSTLSTRYDFERLLGLASMFSQQTLPAILDQVGNWADNFLNLADIARRLSNRLGEAFDAAGMQRVGEAIAILRDHARDAAPALEKMVNTLLDAADRAKQGAEGFKSAANSLRREIIDIEMEGKKAGVTLSKDFYGNLVVAGASSERLGEQTQRLADRFNDLRRELEYALIDPNYDPNKLKEIVDRYRELGGELAQISKTPKSEIIDTSLLSEAADRLDEYGSRLETRAESLRRRASVAFAALVDALQQVAQRAGSSIPELGRSLQALSELLKGLQGSMGIAASQPEKALEGVKLFVSGVARAARDAPPSLYDLGRAFDAIADASDPSKIERRANAFSVFINSISEAARMGVRPILLLARSMEQLADATGSLSGLSGISLPRPSPAAIARAAPVQQISVQAINFNAQVCQSPELQQVAESIMPRVLGAIQREIDRQRALGRLSTQGIC